MKLAVVIAAYDERENVAPLTRRLYATLAGMAGWEHEVLFVVEGQDGTREALEEMGRELPSLKVLYRAAPGGLGAAFRRGFAAVSRDVDFVVTLDADLNHQPEEIPRLVASLASSGDDILIGSRWVTGASVSGTPLWKLTLSWIVGFLMTCLFGLRVHDKTSGFRVYRRAALAHLPFERDNFAFLPEILVLARRAGLSLREEPIAFTYRVHGQSKMGLLTTSASYLSLLRTAFGRRPEGHAEPPRNRMNDPAGTDRPRLSVVVPTHDTRELTLACLAALSRQEIPGLEIILVDDGSSDGTAEALADSPLHQPAVRLLRNEQLQGFTRAANRGLGAARGEILLLLNSDTEVAPGGLATLLAAFAADPGLGAAGGALYYPDGQPQWSGGPTPSLLWLFGLASGLPAWLGRLPLYRRLRPPAGTGPRPVDWVTGAALALRRTALASLPSLVTPGPLDEAFRFYGQDLDLCLRLTAGGWRVAVVPGFRVLHHHGATIGRQGAGRRQPPDLLWTDLLYWAGKARGARFAARATWAIRLGASLRLAARRLARPFVPPAERATFAAETAAFERALRAILEPALAPPPPLV